MSYLEDRLKNMNSYETSKPQYYENSTDGSNDVGVVDSAWHNILGGVESGIGGTMRWAGQNLSSFGGDLKENDMVHNDYYKALGGWLSNNGEYLSNLGEENARQYGVRPEYQNKGVIDRLTDGKYLTDTRGLLADVAQGLGSTAPTLAISAVAPEIGIGSKVASLAKPAVSKVAGETVGNLAGRTIQNGLGFGLTGAAMESTADAGNEIDELRKQGLSEDEITSRINRLAKEEYPLILGVDTVTGSLLGGKFADSTKMSKRAVGNTAGALLDASGEYITEMKQQQLQKELEGKPYGTLLNPMDDEVGAGASGFFGGVGMGGAGAVRGTFFGGRDSELANIDAALRGETEETPQQEQPSVSQGNVDVNFDVPKDQGYIIDDEVSNTNLTNLTDNKLRMLDRDFYNQFGRHLNITSMKRDGDGSSWHDSGQAFDVSDDSLANSKEERDFLMNRGKEYGLYGLDEYENPSENATGGHLHFSDHGEGIGKEGLANDSLIKSSGNADYDAWINQYSKQYGVPANLLFALIDTESGFNPNAESEAGAVGMAQFMPETAKAVGIDPMNPQQAIEGAAIYLKQKYDEAGGSWEGALRGYNSGDVNGHNSETDAYVAKIMSQVGDLSKSNIGKSSAVSDSIGFAPIDFSNDINSIGENNTNYAEFFKDSDTGQINTPQQYLELIRDANLREDEQAMQDRVIANTALESEDAEIINKTATKLGYDNTSMQLNNMPLRAMARQAARTGHLNFANKDSADMFANSPKSQGFERISPTAFKAPKGFAQREDITPYLNTPKAASTPVSPLTGQGVTPQSVGANLLQAIKENNQPINDNIRQKLLAGDVDTIANVSRRLSERDITIPQESVASVKTKGVTAKTLATTDWEQASLSKRREMGQRFVNTLDTNGTSVSDDVRENLLKGEPKVLSNVAKAISAQGLKVLPKRGKAIPTSEVTTQEQITLGNNLANAFSREKISMPKEMSNALRAGNVDAIASAMKIATDNNISVEPVKISKNTEKTTSQNGAQRKNKKARNEVVAEEAKNAQQGAQDVTEEIAKNSAEKNDKTVIHNIELSSEGKEAYVLAKETFTKELKKGFSDDDIELASTLLAYRAETVSGIVREVYQKPYKAIDYVKGIGVQQFEFTSKQGGMYLHHANNVNGKLVDHFETPINTATKQMAQAISINSKESAKGNHYLFTLLHELGHMFFTDMTILAEHENCPEQLKHDLADLQKWINGNEEKIANAIPKYIATENTPVTNINKIVHYVKAKLKQFAKQIQEWINAGEINGSLATDFEIPANVKEIIDRMITPQPKPLPVEKNSDNDVKPLLQVMEKNKREIFLDTLTNTEKQVLYDFDSLYGNAADGVQDAINILKEEKDNEILDQMKRLAKGLQQGVIPRGVKYDSVTNEQLPASTLKGGTLNYDWYNEFYNEVGSLNNSKRSPKDGTTALERAKAGRFTPKVERALRNIAENQLSKGYYGNDMSAHTSQETEEAWQEREDALNGLRGIIEKAKGFEETKEQKESREGSQYSEETIRPKEERAEVGRLYGKLLNEYNSGKLEKELHSDTEAEIKESTEDSEAVVVTGNEFGEYSNIKELRKKAKTYYKNNLQGTSVTNPTLGKVNLGNYDIDFTGKGISKALSTSAKANKLLLIKHLPQLIENAKAISSRENIKDKRNASQYTYLLTQAIIDGKKQDVTISVFTDNNGNHYYNHILDSEENKNRGLSVYSVQAPRKGNGIPTVQQSSVNSTISQLTEENKQSINEKSQKRSAEEHSKAIDDNEIKLSASDDLKKVLANNKYIDDSNLTPAEMILNNFAKTMGMPITFFSNPEINLHGYHTENGRTFINRNSEMPLKKVFWHETFHWLANNNPRLYGQLVKHIKAISPEQLIDYRKKIGRTDMSDKLTVEEMLADNMINVRNRIDFFTQLGLDNRSLAEKITAWVKSMLDKFINFINKAITSKELPSRDRTITIDQLNQFVKGFDRIMRGMTYTDDKGITRPIFVKNKETGNFITVNDMKPILHYSIDNSDNMLDNDGKELANKVFDKYLTQGIKEMIASKVNEAINNIDFSQIKDMSDFEEAVNRTKYIKKRLTWFNDNSVQNKPGYKNRMSAIIEYARRCFINDKRTRELGIVRQNGVDGRQGRSEAISNDSVRDNRTRSTGKSGQSIWLNEYKPVSSKQGYHKHFLELMKEEDDRKTKFSLDNSESQNQSKVNDWALQRLADSMAKHIGTKGADNVIVKKKAIDKGYVHPARRFFSSPQELRKKYPRIGLFVDYAKKATNTQEKLRYHFTEKMNEAEKVLGLSDSILKRNDSKYKARRERIVDILWQGDAEQKEFTDSELKEMGADENIIKAYKIIRGAIKEAYDMANNTKQQASIVGKEMSYADYEALKQNKFVKIINHKELYNRQVLVNYRSPKLYEKADIISADELAELRKDANVQIHSAKPANSMKNTMFSNGDYYRVRYTSQTPPMGNIKGYIPHMFHDWFVVKKNADGTFEIITSERGIREATKKANEYATKNKDAELMVVPKQFEYPQEAMQAAIMGDLEYSKAMSKLAKKMSMTIKEAQSATNDIVKMKNRGRFFGNAMHRKGAKGYDEDAFGVLRHYFNQTGRYVALDEFKRKAYSEFERTYGNFDRERLSPEAKMVRSYINDVNGVPTDTERWINDILINLPFIKSVGNGRPAMVIANNLTYISSIAKLGMLNMGSALMNLTQLMNMAGAMGSYGYFTKGIKVYKETLKDKKKADFLNDTLGLKYEMGLDIAGGYSRAEIAGKFLNGSMYFFSKSDKIARAVTLLGAYQKAIDEGKTEAEAIKYAKDINRQVNFDYSVADAPDMFRRLGPISQVWFQFMKFPIKQIELFYNITAKGYKDGGKKGVAKAIFKYCTPYMALAGITGVPFISLIGAFLNAAHFMFIGGDWDWEKELKRLTLERFGADSIVTRTLLYGALANTSAGISVGGRIGVGDFMKPSVPNNLVEAFAKVFGTTGSSLYQVMRQYHNGNFAEGIKAISPEMGNFAQAIVNGETRTTNGRLQYKFDGVYEKFIYGILGYTPINKQLESDVSQIEYYNRKQEKDEKQDAIEAFLQNPTTENRKRLQELNIAPKSVRYEREKRNKSATERLRKEQEKKKSKKPKQYKESEYK